MDLAAHAKAAAEPEALAVPAICRRDGCGGAHYHPITGAEPDYHYQDVDSKGFITWKPRWRNVWKRGKDRRLWWYTPNEVCETLGISRKTLARRLGDGPGQLRYARLGERIIRIRGADLEAWLRTQGKIAP